MTRRGFLGAAAGAIAVRAAGPGVLERYVAIDNVCAWPKLTRLREGGFAAAIYNQPSHGRMTGGVDCWTSADARLWRLAGTVAKPDRADAMRANHAIGQLRGGELLAMSSGWIRAESREVNHYPGKGTLMRATVHVSRDGGSGWRQVGELPDGPEGYHLIPFGNIVLDGDGAPHVAAYVYRPSNPRRDTCWMLRGSADGAQWRRVGTIGDAVHNETDIAWLGEGKWLAAARAIAGPDTPVRTDLLRSGDGGATWRPAGFSTAASELPGDVCVLHDGAVVLTYGSRRSEFLGVAARWSRDGGATWSEPLRIAETTSTDCGYPSSVELDDGAIATAYYAKGSREHHRYHMGVTIWRAG